MASVLIVPPLSNYITRVLCALSQQREGITGRGRSQGARKQLDVDATGTAARFCESLGQILRIIKCARLRRMETLKCWARAPIAGKSCQIAVKTPSTRQHGRWDPQASWRKQTCDYSNRGPLLCPARPCFEGKRVRGKGLPFVMRTPSEHL